MCRSYQNQLFADKANLFFPAQSGKKRVLLSMTISAACANFPGTEDPSDSDVPRAKTPTTPSSEINFFSLRALRSLREIFRDRPVREAHPTKTFVSFVPPSW
jgi:hypothetical protein